MAYEASGSEQGPGRRARLGGAARRLGAWSGSSRVPPSSPWRCSPRCPWARAGGSERNAAKFDAPALTHPLGGARRRLSSAARPLGRGLVPRRSPTPATRRRRGARRLLPALPAARPRRSRSAAVARGGAGGRLPRVAGGAARRALPAAPARGARARRGALAAADARCCCASSPAPCSSARPTRRASSCCCRWARSTRRAPATGRGRAPSRGARRRPPAARASCCCCRWRSSAGGGGDRAAALARRRRGSRSPRAGSSAYAVYLELATGDGLAFLERAGGLAARLRRAARGRLGRPGGGVRGAPPAALGVREVVYFEQAAGDPFRVGGAEPDAVRLPRVRGGGARTGWSGGCRSPTARTWSPRCCCRSRSRSTPAAADVPAALPRGAVPALHVARARVRGAPAHRAGGGGVGARLGPVRDRSSPPGTFSR